ncbi:glycoside hydrolase family 28 protein [Limosilactobacillus fermentum]|uniref:glycoside hydrolase family 28 protein n=1 Tax=Limosilactobacillus fermentum TaxID=1613 RepID=UPI000CE2AE92|nr:glycosyl hydrolase family 28 protein [Limosilactobacillus fermentum]SNX32508.1 putative polygalacturonase [Limosilactobacillus fermentum]
MKIDVLEENLYTDIKDHATNAIQRAINECFEDGGGIVEIPAGEYTINSLELKSHVTLELKKGALLKGSGDEKCYFHRPGPFELLGNHTSISSLIYARNQKEIAIIGEGTIDGNYRQFVLPNQGNEPHLKFYKYPRPMVVYFEGCQNVLLQEITLQQAPFWTVHLVGDINVEVANLRIENEVRMPNTDGIDIDRSKNVYIHDCYFHTGDDAICPKCTEETSQYGDVTNLRVENCQITTQSAAVKFGSSSFGNFENCTFKNLVIKDTNCGIAFQLRDPGSARNVLFKDITIETKHYSEQWWGAGEPIYITLLPRNDQTDLSGQVIENIHFKNIQCHAENGIVMQSVDPGQIQKIIFDQVHLALRQKVGQPVLVDFRPWNGDDDTTKNATQLAAESKRGGKKPVGKVTRTLRPIMDQSQSKYQLIDCDVVDESRTRREGFGNDNTKD